MSMPRWARPPKGAVLVSQISAAAGLVAMGTSCAFDVAKPVDTADVPGDVVPTYETTGTSVGSYPDTGYSTIGTAPTSDTAVTTSDTGSETGDTAPEVSDTAPTITHTGRYDTAGTVVDTADTGGPPDTGAFSVPMLAPAPPPGSTTR